MVRFGIVGCGYISRFHFDGIEKAGDKVTYIVDINETAAAPWCEKTGAKFSTDYMDLINSPDVDVVSVLAGVHLHKEICIAALEAGKDVVCEKTMANSPEDAEEIVRAAQKSGRLFFTAYMKRFFPAVVKAKELFPSLGRIFSVHARSYQPWNDLFTAPRSLTPGKSYGGALLKCAGSHILDMIMNFLGRPQSVYATIDFIEGTNFDRKATSILEFEGGVTASFEALGHPHKKIGFLRDSWDEKIEINGVDGRLEIYFVLWHASEKNAALLVHYDNNTQTSTEYRFDAVSSFDIEMKEISQAVETRNQIHPDVVDGFNVDVVIGAMEESNSSKAAVKINWRGI